VLPYQIVLWASVAHPAAETLSPNTPRFPVVLDPGFNHNFLIREEQLQVWADLRPDQFRFREYRRARGQPVPWYHANVWLHPNEPGERDRFANRPPFCLQLRTGIGITPRPSTTPRLPLLGLRALFAAGLQLSLDCRRGLLSLRTPRRFWIFG